MEKTYENRSNEDNGAQQPRQSSGDMVTVILNTSIILFMQTMVIYIFCS